ncbi:MAG: VWA domain-containing protein [Acidobacteriota bacterium]
MGTRSNRPLLPPLSSLLILLALVALGHAPQAARAQQGDAPSAADAPDPEALLAQALRTAPTEAEQLLAWPDEVAPLITRAERDRYQTLTRDHQRRAFIDAFWRVRDPYPRTARNELKERWPVRVAEAQSRFGGLDNDRARILLLHDRPEARLIIRCSDAFQPAELWAYRGTPLVDAEFVLIFLRYTPQSQPQLWVPGRSGAAAEEVIRRARPCQNGARLNQIVAVLGSRMDDYQPLVQRVLQRPRPRSTEWLDVFAAFSTDAPADATGLPGTLDVSFPGRHQNRTVVQGVITVPREELAVVEFAGYRAQQLRLTGEVVRDDVLFERFRYKFGFPLTQDETPTGPQPLAFQRYLRPGTYTLIVRLDDLNGDAVLRRERALVVPEADGPAPDAAPPQDPISEQIFAEAITALADAENGIRILAPQGGTVPLTGSVRFDALTTGEAIQKVAFTLDGRAILTKNRAPYDVRLDLGPHPDLHTVEAIGYDAAGNEVARDSLLVNGGGYRFGVTLREPRADRGYETSLRVRAEVEVPAGRSLDRLEIFLGETRVATLFQPPFIQPIALPSTAPTYVRAVAYLPDGNATEDLVFVNAPDYVDAVDVQMVELYTSVLDGRSRPVLDLARGDFAPTEDGVAQEIVRFERVRDLPIHVGVVLDTSASMAPVWADVREAALAFFRDALAPRDRAAVITFSDAPRLLVPLTNEIETLGAGLLGVTTEGRTALYDSVMFGLYYLTGVRGQRAMLLLSDGKDEASRFDYAQTLDYARRAGITIYAIGLRQGGGAPRARLRALADETGGRAFFVDRIESLDEVYRRIQEELRAQYLIAYQSNQPVTEENRGTFRRIELEVDRPGVEVRTLSGYYP